jgi:hypothetical protein
MTWRKLKGIQRFIPSEFSEDPEKYADPELIYALDSFAIALGSPVHPSPAPGALARFDGSVTSRHYAINRRSDGSDVFCSCPIFKAWSTALQAGEFNGIGVYFDTHYRGDSWPMLHLDMRPPGKRIVWFRDEEGRYHYPKTDPDFWQNLVDRLAVQVMMKG